MGARAGISVAEYLHSSFPDLDREYRDGELVERSVPDYLHGRTQALLLVFFEALRKKLSFYACSETRVKVREGLYLIPDVSVFRPSPPPSSVPDQPPFIAVEILSPDDRLNAVREKAQAIFENLTDEKAYQLFVLEWMQAPYIEMQLYAMRHIQEHAAQLNLFLGQQGVTGQDWVAQAREKAS